MGEVTLKARLHNSARQKTSSPADVEVRGIDLDGETRCVHYRSALDIVAIRMKCCGVYYACKDCHEALADHPAQVWPQAEWGRKAVLCGTCRQEMTIEQYLTSEYRCPSCRAAFNPGCRNHYDFYFARSAGLDERS